jgi:hypothetical protein
MLSFECYGLSATEGIDPSKMEFFDTVTLLESGSGLTQLSDALDQSS